MFHALQREKCECVEIVAIELGGYGGCVCLCLCESKEKEEERETEHKGDQEQVHFVKLVWFIFSSYIFVSFFRTLTETTSRYNSRCAPQ